MGHALPEAQVNGCQSARTEKKEHFLAISITKMLVSREEEKDQSSVTERQGERVQCVKKAGQ